MAIVTISDKLPLVVRLSKAVNGARNAIAPVQAFPMFFFEFFFALNSKVLTGSILVLSLFSNTKIGRV